jgi:hypothetical protein
MVVEGAGLLCEAGELLHPLRCRVDVAPDLRGALSELA